MRYALLLIVFSLALASLIHCTSSTAPIDYAHLCDKEKRAVWAALGHQDAVPDSLMLWGEWNMPESPRGLQGETYYFLPLREGCKVMRA